MNSGKVWMIYTFMVHVWWMESETVVIAFPLAPSAGAGAGAGAGAVAWNRRLCHHHRSFIRTRRDGNEGDGDGNYGDGNEGGLTSIKLSISEEEQPFAIPPPISAPVKELEAPEASAAPSSPQLASTDITTASTDTTGTTTGTTASGFRQEAPKYNGEAKAIDVFSDEWFYFTSSHAQSKFETRKTVLGDSTIAALTDSCIKYPKEFATSIGAIEETIREYFLTGDLDLKKRILLPKLIQNYGGTFETCIIPTSKIQESLEPLSEQSSQRALNMSFLDNLRLPNDNKEKFFPQASQSIYVRDCMRTVFGLFQDDITNGESFTTAFIGSPGVGKSVLFFLSALYQAQTTNVVYCRRTNVEKEPVSIFVMTPNGDDSVRVWFNRAALSDKTEINDFIGDLDDILPRKEYSIFIDGPKHDDKNNILSGHYNYLCTSGGHPGYKSEERAKRLWVLDAWSKDEVVAALSMMGYNQNDASDAYDVCGGRIRDILSGWSQTGFDKVTNESNLIALLTRVSPNDAALYVQSSEGNLERDSILSMFAQKETNEAWRRRMPVIQIV